MAQPLGAIFWVLSVLTLCLGIGNYISMLGSLFGEPHWLLLTAAGTVNQYSRKVAIVQTGWKTQLVSHSSTSLSIVELMLDRSWASSRLPSSGHASFFSSSPRFDGRQVPLRSNETCLQRIGLSQILLHNYQSPYIKEPSLDHRLPQLHVTMSQPPYSYRTDPSRSYPQLVSPRRRIAQRRVGIVACTRLHLIRCR